jgi:hypothetical protein
MTRDEMMDLMLGVAVVALGYALYKHHKAGQGGTSNAPIPNIPAPPMVWHDENGNYFYDLDKLMQGVL